ncbi:MAG: PmoA family protein [Thermoguttaceae bacterium]|nr:PmoA family protein [Thermoguttaceae bacterium]MDW8036496.1 PmoA family protein [Thermoguttaceae bacterium]
MLKAFSLFGGLWFLAQMDQQGVAWAAESGRHSVQMDGAMVLVYQAAPNPKKPYLAELFSPAGVNLLRDSPADHKHHHGLMFAVAVDGVNFWAEDAASGSQVPIGPLKQERIVVDGRAWEVLRQNLRWQNPQGAVMLEEERTLAACRTDQPTATLLSWRSLLRAPEGRSSVQLGGSSYFGLGMRFTASMDIEGRFFNAQGQSGPEATNKARAAWCAYTAKADGKPVTVAVFDWPKNPRHPATWFTMDRPFAYLSATLNLDQEPLTIRAGQPVELRYGVAVWDGQVERAVVEKCYKAWWALGGADPSSSSPQTQLKP